MNDSILEELRKMTALLQAIDWKMWDMHQKFESRYQQQETTPKKEEVVQQPAGTQQTYAEVIDMNLVSATQPKPSIPTAAVKEVTNPVISVPKYPTIEEWK